METENIAIFIPDEDAKKFLLFQEHYDIFTLLLEKGVFTNKNATILLDFDKFGELKSIRRNDFLFSTRE